MVALAGWVVVAMWGWAALMGADSMRTDPGMIRGDEKAALLEVSGGLLLIAALALAGGACIRLINGRERLAPPWVTVVLGWGMVSLFAAFFLWGVRLTRHQGVAALAAFELPYLVAGVAVLFARPAVIAPEPA